MNRSVYTFSRSINLFVSSLVLTGTLFSCQPGEKKQESTTDQPSAAEVQATDVFPLQRGRLSSSLKIPGELIAWQQVDLYAKENSFVKKLYVDVGTEVKEGQLLVAMDAPEFASQLAGASSNVQSREAVYIASKSNYDRLLATSQTPGTISPVDLEQAAARKAADFAQLQAAKDAYQQVAEIQKYLQIKAPFSGVITARNVNQGAYVGPSGKGSELPLFTLKEQKKLRLVIAVPEAYTSYLKPGNEINFTVKALPDQNFKALIKRLAGTIDSRLHAQRIEMDVENKDKKLLPGMVAEVTLPLPAGDSTFIVPRSAVVNAAERIFVIRLTDHKAEWVNVKPGRTDNNDMEIYGKLNQGDLLVKTATEEVRNGSDLKNVHQQTKTSNEQ